MINSSRGAFNLIGTLVALLISTGVMLATTTVIFQISKDKAKVNLQAQVDFLHLEGLQILSNQKHLKKLFLDQHPQAYACFQDRGSSCRSLHNQVLMPMDSDGKIVLNSYFGVNGPCASDEQSRCPFQRTASVKFECSSDSKCERVQVDLQTNYTGSQQLRSQRTTKYLSARALDQRRSLDFSCASAGRFVTGIDYENLRAKCGGLPEYNLNCGTELSLQSFGQDAPQECHPSPVYMNCGSKGVSATSLYGGSGACTL